MLSEILLYFKSDTSYVHYSTEMLYRKLQNASESATKSKSHQSPILGPCKHSPQIKYHINVKQDITENKKQNISGVNKIIRNIMLY